MRFLIASAFAVAAAAIVTAAPAAANVVTDWNERVFTLLAPLNGAEQTRARVIMHAAIFDALDAIEPRYRPYLAPPAPAPRDASMDAAASAAARGVLLVLAPGQKTAIDAAYAAETAAIPDGSAKRDGVLVGERAARTILEQRANDGFDTSRAYTPKSGPGAYVPTSDGPMAYPNFAKMRPFVIAASNQFRPPAPPAITSAAFARDMTETRVLGGADSSERTAAQTMIARFHAPPGGAPFNEMARSLSNRAALDALDTARVFALLNFAQCDAQSAIWDAKYTYDFWRPSTAIAAAGVTDWTPLLVAPLHPEYPCAHCGIGVAAGRVLEAIFGPNAPVTIGSENVPGAPRSFASVHAYVEEEAVSRIYAGAHFRNSVAVGETIGTQVGDVVAQALPRRQ